MWDQGGVGTCLSTGLVDPPTRCRKNTVEQNVLMICIWNVFIHHFDSDREKPAGQLIDYQQ